MRDSVPSGSYSSVCNVLRQWQSRSSLLIESTDSMIYIYTVYTYIHCIYVCTLYILSYMYSMRQKECNKRATVALENMAPCAPLFFHRVCRTLMAAPQCAVL